MKRMYTINQYEESYDVITMHHETAEMLKIQPYQGMVHVTFGLRTIPLLLVLTKMIDQNEIKISPNVLKFFGIPHFGGFELKADQNGIVIGPFIGLMTHLTEMGHKRLLSDIDGYLLHYQKIGGTIVSFSLENIQIGSSLIEGYIFNPETFTWEPATFPYPAAILNKCRMIPSNKWDYLATIYQDKIINFPTFNKMEMYEWFSPIPSLMKVLPETILCETSDDILQFLIKHNKAYVKPIIGTFAKGVLELSLTSRGVLLRYPKQRKTVHRFLASEQEFHKFFRKRLKREPHLIQEAINLIKINDKQIDFRLIFIKNADGKWIDLGLFARLGKKGSAVSNITAGGKAKTGINTLRRALGISRKHANYLYHQMVEICHLAALELEKHLDQCGNLGFDFGIDENMRIWIIEINNEDPDHRIALVADRKDILYEARLQNMLYTKRLAGFPS